MKNQQSSAVPVSDKFTPHERRAIRQALLIFKRFWNAPANSELEGEQVDSLLDLIETIREFE